MSLFGRLFKNPELPHAPERYPEFYLRWERDGEPYGPMFFDHLFRSWRNEPVQGRFVNEQRWRPFAEFRTILAHLHASSAQVQRLEKLGAPISGPGALSYTEAFQRIGELEEIRSAARSQRQAELDAEPVKPNIRKQLAQFNIDCPSTLTNGEAKALVRAHKERLALDEQWQDITPRLTRLGVSIDYSQTEAWQASTDKAASPLDDLEHILSELDGFPALAKQFPWPEPLQPANAAPLLDKIMDAVRAAEDAEYTIRERELVVDQGQYRLMGKMPKAQMNQLRLAVALQEIAGIYAEERDLLPLIQRYLPEVRFRDLDD